MEEKSYGGNKVSLLLLSENIQNQSIKLTKLFVVDFFMFFTYISMYPIMQ